MVDAQGFGISLAINAGIGIIAFLLFCALRTKHPHIYQPRANDKKRNLGAVYPSPPPLPSGMFAWIAPLVKMTDQDLVKYAGPDAWVMSNMFSTLAILFLFSTVFAIGVLLPLNVTGGNDQTEFDQLSLGNIALGSHRFWAHLIYCYAFTGLAFYLLMRVWVQLLDVRVNWLKRQYFSGALHTSTLLYHNLAANINNDQTFAETMETLYPNQISTVNLAKNIKGLNEAIEKRNAALAALEKAIVVYETKLQNPDASEKDKQRPNTATKCLCCKKVDALEYYHGELQKWNALISEFQTADANRELLMLKSGFVTFKSPSVFHAAATAVVTKVPFEFSCRPAPEPRDVYWPNLNLTQAQRVLRRVGMWAATIALCFFWIIPVAIVQSLANLKGLSGKVFFLKDFIDAIPGSLLSFIEGFLPPLVLVIFFAILPMILMGFAKIQGIEAHSWLQMQVVKFFYIFQVLNSFLFIVLAGAIFQNISGFIDSPTSITSILAETIPGVSTFFINLIALSTFAAFPLMLLNIGGIIVNWIFKKWLLKTKRQFDAADNPPALNFGSTIPSHLLPLIIAFCYSAIAPVVLPFACVFYALGWLVFRYNFTYVYVNQQFETGGMFWPLIFNRICVSIIVGQVTWAGVMGLKQWPPAFILLFLAPITYLFMRYCKNAYESKLLVLPINECVNVEREKDNKVNQISSVEKKEDSATQEVVFHPSVSVDGGGVGHSPINANSYGSTAQYTPVAMNSRVADEHAQANDKANSNVSATESKYHQVQLNGPMDSYDPPSFDFECSSYTQPELLVGLFPAPPTSLSFKDLEDEEQNQQPTPQVEAQKP